MKELIIDVEATCWDSKEKQGDKKNEIIEIGYSVVEGGKIVENGGFYIKPVQSEVSAFCTRLTGITQKKADSGLSPKAAYSKLQRLFSGCSRWGSYGNYDKSIILSNCREIHGIDIDTPPHFNIRKLAAEKLQGKEDPYSVPSNPKDVIDSLRLGWTGRNHNGKDDALNIARLYLYLRKMPVKDGKPLDY